jgi:hypothetical protein
VLTVLMILALFLAPILSLAQEAADPEVVEQGPEWVKMLLGLLATNGLLILFGIWSLIQKTKLKNGAVKVMSVLWTGCDKAQEVAEAGKAVLAYLADPTEANKARAEKECADLRVVKG